MPAPKKKWTLGPEDRDVVLAGQMTLDELLAEGDRGDLDSVPQMLDRVRRDDGTEQVSAP